jgi:hypothetical protein
MKTYNVYYLASGQGIVAGPFPTIDAAVHGKSKFEVPYRVLLSVVKSTIEVEEL